MEKLDCVVKDILLKRSLHYDEVEIIRKAVTRLHQDALSVHLDMKPSNIGCLTDKDGYIKEIKFIDLQKLQKSSQCQNPLDFQKLTDRDNNTFKKHVVKNMTKDRKDHGDRKDRTVRKHHRHHADVDKNKR
jgi:hypothetical protein